MIINNIVTEEIISETEEVISEQRVAYIQDGPGMVYVVRFDYATGTSLADIKAGLQTKINEFSPNEILLLPEVI